MARKNTELLYRIITVSIHIKHGCDIAVNIVLRQILRATQPKAEQQHNGETATEQRRGEPRVIHVGIIYQDKLSRKKHSKKIFT
jgi:hypothetical protein